MAFEEQTAQVAIDLGKFPFVPLPLQRGTEFLQTAVFLYLHFQISALLVKGEQTLMHHHHLFGVLALLFFAGKRGRFLRLLKPPKLRCSVRFPVIIVRNIGADLYMLHRIVQLLAHLVPLPGVLQCRVHILREITFQLKQRIFVHRSISAELRHIRTHLLKNLFSTRRMDSLVIPCDAEPFSHHLIKGARCITARLFHLAEQFIVDLRTEMFQEIGEVAVLYLLIHQLAIARLGFRRNVPLRFQCRQHGKIPPHRCICPLGSLPVSRLIESDPEEILRRFALFQRICEFLIFLCLYEIHIPKSGIQLQEPCCFLSGGLIRPLEILPQKGHGL